MCTDLFHMLDRYKYVSPDEDPDELMDQDVVLNNELSEYNYDEEDDLIEEADNELNPPLFVAPRPTPPPPAFHAVPDDFEFDEKETQPVVQVKRAVPARKAVPVKKAASAKKAAPAKKKTAPLAKKAAKKAAKKSPAKKR